MSAITQLSVLALASTAFAGQFAGYQHGHLHGRHQRLHTRPVGTGTEAPYAYPTVNGTGIWNSTGYGSSTSVAAAEMPTASYGSGGNTYTISNIHTETVHSTIYADHPASSAAEQCAADVTVTNTEKVYVTVTAGQSAFSSAEVSAVESTSAAASYSTPAAYGAASSNTQAAPVSSASSSAAAGYSAPAYSSNEASPVASSSAGGYSAPAYSSAPSGSSTSVADTTSAAQYSSSPVPATSAAALPTSYAAASSQGSGSGSATASAPASYGSSSSSSGKRGLAYNDASLTSCFEGSTEISWAYNWVSSTGDLSDNVMYIPTLWGNADTYTNSWNADAKKGISNGATHLFSFNEPDHTAQANLDYTTAASAYKKWMNPFAGQAKLCAPSVTNGGDQMGLTYLKNFLDACNSGDEKCHIDCINIHWYDSASNTAYFKKHINDAKAIAGDLPIYVTEFGATGSDSEINSFLQEVMPWMDSDSQIAGYAYYMVSEGLLVSGGEPTTYGSTYKTYTS